MVIKIKRGTAAQVTAADLQEREFAFDKDNNDLYVGAPGGDPKIKVTNNSVYTAAEYATNFLPKLPYGTEDYGDVCPLDAGGYIPTNKLPPQIGDEVDHIMSLSAPGIANKLYILQSDNTLWRYKNGMWIQLLEWPNFTFDGGTL